MAQTEEKTALIIEHTVKVSEQKRYEKWLAEILNAVSRASGYLGREVFPQGGTGKTYTTIVRFNSPENLHGWLGSAERSEFIEQLDDILENGDRTTIKAGIDVWFEPADAPRKTPAYKQFLVTLAGIYPLSLIVPNFLSPLFASNNLLGNRFVSGFFVSAVIVGLMTYLVMPNATRLLHGWLNAQTKGEKSND